MIYYFSGTGNSEFVAKRLGELLTLDCKRIVGLEKTRLKISKDEPFIVVYPTIAYGMPSLIKSFLDFVDFSGTYSALLTTCAKDSGGQLRRYQKKYNFNHLNELYMPNNYITSKKGVVDSKSHQEDLVNNAYIKLNRIRNDISREIDFCEHSKSHFKLIKNLIHDVYMENKLTTKEFTINDNCDSCGKCEEVCPVDAIKIVDGKPVWESKECEQCLRCLHTCPKNAIDYKYSAGKERYLYFPMSSRG